MTDDDLRQVIRDFQASVSAEIRSLADRLDRRLARIETRLDEHERPQT